MTSKRRVSCRFGIVVLFLFLSTLVSFAQDSRTVTEPAFPAACAVLTAQLQSVNGDLPAAAESSFDTTRIQGAINACPAGQAVELAADAGGNNAYLIQPITLAPGVTLLVDPGVTVFASRNPRDYDVQAGSCGIVASTSAGCQPVITVSNAPDSAIMGFGVINGRGGDTLLGSGAPANTSWWDLASQAQQQSLSQFVPVLVAVNGSSNFILYKITLINSPMFHVTYHGGPGIDGFTAWGVKITTPFSSRNTDGIDPSNATDVTITNSYISDGDDNVAVGASQSLASNISVINDHFYSGHGMSIGSFTAGGVSNMVVDNVQFAGNASDPNAIGIRIKSADDRGGTISNVSYSHICIQNIREPLVFNPFYNTNPGTLIPNFQSITLSNVHVLTEGKIQLDGANSSFPLGLTLDNVVFDSLKATDLSPAPENANITLGPGPVSSNLVSNLSGSGVNVTNNITNPGEAPFGCTNAFVFLAGELTAPSSTVTQGQLVNLTALVQPVIAGAALPTGTVQILENGATVGTATLSGASYLINIALPNVNAGSHTYSALYSGDSNYASLAFGSFTVAVTTNSLIPSQTQLSGVPPSVSFGTAIAATATVSSGSGSPTGTVTFLQGNNQLATVPLSSGQASSTIAGLPAGSYQISAAYNGDQNFAGSISAPVSLTVVPAATTTSLVSSSNQVTAGTTVALTITVSSSAGVPTGNVNLMDGTQQIGTAPLVNGTAAVNAALGVGNHSLTAVYIASQNYATSTSAAVSVTVTPGSGATASVLPDPLPFLVSTVAGGATANCSTSTSSVGDGCPATQVVLSTDLRAVATDAFGNLFFTDTNNNRVRQISATTGVIATFAGGATACAAKTDSYGDGCPAAQTGNFNHPRGLWIDSAGNVFIAGFGNNIVHKVQASNGIMVQVAGVITGGSGTSGAGADNIPATTSALNQPRGVWTDANGNIYIADTGNNKIRVVYVGGVIPNVATPVPGNIYTVAGNGTSGTTGDGGPANGAGVELKTPQGGVTDNNGNVFISDGGGRVRVVFMGGTLIAKLIAIENSGTTAQVGNIYTIAGGSSKAFTVPALATSVAVGGPQKLFLDAGNNLYIADSNANSVWFLDVRTGFIRRILGGATTVCSAATDAFGDGCPGTQATITSGGNGVGVTLDNHGNLYVTDTTDLRIRKVSPDLQFAPVAVGSTATQTVLMHYVAGDSPAASNAFGLPSSFTDFSLAGAPNCTLNTDTTTDCLLQLQFAPVTPGARSAPLTVSSTAGSVAHFGLGGQGLGAGGAIDPAQLGTIGENLSPQGVAVDSGGNVYVADGNSKQVLKFAPGSSTGIPVLTGLTEPQGVAVDAVGNVYVADIGAGKVLQAAANGTLQNVGSGLVQPSGVALDGNGNIYIADAGQSKLVTVSSDLSLQRTLGSGFTTPAAVAVDGGFNIFVADPGATTVTKISPSGSSTVINTGAITPAGVAVDAAGNLYVSDAGAQTVIELPVASGSSPHTVVANLTTPNGLALDGVGKVYVADSGATKIIQLERTQGVLNFPDTTTVLTATLSNIGNQPVTPTGTGFTQTDTTDFNLSTSGSNGCNFSANLAAGSACNLTAQFTPQANGALADVATLTGNYANLATAPFHTLNLTLFGNGSITFPTQLNIAPISPASPIFGQPITLAATVTSTGGTPTGSVTFAIDGVALSPLLLDGSGAVSTTVANVPAGTHTLTALYSGSIQFSGSTGAPVPFSVTQAGTSVTWTPPSNNIVYGTTLAATLDPISSVPGSFTYTAQNGSAAAFPVNAATVLPVGSYQLTATFAPADSIDFLPSSANINLTVSQAGTTAGLGVTQSVVAADGTGNFATINAGLQSLSSSGGSLYIKPGTYKEQDIITAPNVSLYGLGGDPTQIILTDDLSNGPNNLNAHLGDQGSATVQALGDSFYADNITFQNTFDFENNQDTTPNAQALALWVTGDHAIFNNSRFVGRQDTIFGGSKGCTSTTCTSARQYFFQAYVEGNVDYIFGDGATVFESSTIHTVYHAKATNEATITAQNKKFSGAGSYLSGEVFSNCTLTAENDNGTMTNLFLGRPFGTFSTNVYLNTNMQAPINGAGWIEFTPGVTNNLPTSFYAEFNSTGPGALGPREPFAVQLTATTAAPFQPLTFLAGSDGWNPQTSLAQRAAAVVPAAQSLTVQQGSPFTLVSRISPAVGGAPTGTVQFFDNGNLVTTVNVDATLEATLSTSSLTVGNHAITIQYSGDGNFIGSTSSPVNITITPATTNLALSLSSSTSTYGNTVTATASLTTSGQGTPTGTVTFSVDNQSLPAVPIVNNSASLTLPLSALTAGTHNVSATYSGDANFSSSNSNTASVAVAQATTTTVLTSSAASAAFGTPATFTAKVTPAIAGVPTGTAQFFDGANLLGTSALDATGAANFTTSALSVGAHSVTVQYSGDANFITSTSAAVNITITPASTSLALAISPSTPTYGSPITATASLTIPGQGTPTGTVTFSIDGQALPLVPIVNNSASLPLPVLTAGTHSVSAAYSGDANFTAANSNTVSLVVAQAATTTNLTTSNAAPAFGTPTTLTAKVAPPAAGVPTGTAQFFDGPNSLATVPLDATGAASFTTSSLSVGAHSITVQYSADANFTASSSPAVNITVTRASTSLSLTLSSNAPTYGSAVTATAALTIPGQGTPTGTVTFSVDGKALPPVPISNNVATVSLPLTVLTAGPHSVSAAYSGDANFTASVSNTVSVTVTQAATTTVVTSSAATAAFGSLATFTAKVAPAGAGLPTGTAQFFDGSNPLATITLDATGAASFATSSLSVGVHSITVHYSGDANFTASTSSQVSITITPAATSLTLTVSPNAPVFGNPITATASITFSAPAIPGGTVTFSVDGTTLPAVTVANNAASLVLSTLSAGTHTISASYSGDGNFAPSAAGPVTVNVAPTATTVALTGSASNAFVGAPVTFTASVTSASGNTLTGTVTFLDGATPISPAVPLSGNTASFSTSALALGVHTITAQYSGDANHLGSVSPSFAVTIVVRPDFSIALGRTVLRLDDGSTPVDTVTLTPIGAYSGTISFSCSGLPRGTVCDFDPPSVTLANGKSQVTFLRIRRTRGGDGDGHQFPITITATDGVIRHTVTLTLVVED